MKLPVHHPARNRDQCVKLEDLLVRLYLAINSGTLEGNIKVTEQEMRTLEHFCNGDMDDWLIQLRKAALCGEISDNINELIAYASSSSR